MCYVFEFLCCNRMQLELYLRTNLYRPKQVNKYLFDSNEICRRFVT